MTIRIEASSLREIAHIITDMNTEPSIVQTAEVKLEREPPLNGRPLQAPAAQETSEFLETIPACESLKPYNADIE